jgi:hypothetical protein
LVGLVERALDMLTPLFLRYFLCHDSGIRRNINRFRESAPRQGEVTAVQPPANC